VWIWRYRLEMGLFGCLFLGEEEREKVGGEGERGRGMKVGGDGGEE